ncbi:hypothetical protein Misp06_01743 [Microbulbifer sp. NBRC 101763]|uniref:hypothetical protein n=1 Tax=Microbulbifer TaxID=48073 RepID=UPI00035DB1D5|nr:MULTISPECIES: hypothetical protein [Microbulbifer]WHI51048.1 hypothetical protein P3339_22045 [Microbulbifer sp. MLAF003]
MTKSGNLEVVLLGLTLCAVMALSMAQNLWTTWLALEWLAFICLLSFYFPKMSMITDFLSNTVTRSLWPESRQWL